MLKENTDMESSQVYGAEHLLRLFGIIIFSCLVQLPSLIAHTNMDVDATNTLKDHLILILEYLLKNQGDFFLEEYVTAPPSYIVD
jgi:mortality factor 4-like protein 1